MVAPIAGLSPITAYTSILKDEASRIAQYVKSDSQVRRTVSRFEADSVAIASPTDILSGKHYEALAVVTGANNIAGQSGEAGLLRKLLTEDSSAPNSLVRSLGSTGDLDFVQSMTARATVAMDFGQATDQSFTAGGSAASTLSVNNINWSSSDADLTTAAKAESWSYVLDDGSGAASIASALTKAANGTGDLGFSYSVDASGQIVGSEGAPALHASIDGSGNAVYSLTLASDSGGHAVRIANVVAVKAAIADPPSTSTAGTALTVSAAAARLSAAMSATGFNVSVRSDQSGLSIVNPGSDGVLSLSTQSYSAYVTTTGSAIMPGQTLLPLGDAGRGLSAGQVLLSGSTQIGTVKSVDSQGNVTLIAGAAALAAGSGLQVAIGAGLSNIGATFKAGSAIAQGSLLLALGASAATLKPGQTITDGSKIIGVVKSVDGSGNVALNGGSASAIAAGDLLSVVPKTTDTTTAALSDSTNVAALARGYETSQFEKSEGKQVKGLDDALYFTRVAPSITSLGALMSDSSLLKVVVTDLGLATTYYNLSYDQQKQALSKFDVSSLANPKTVQKYAEQYLALTSNGAANSYSATQIGLALLTGTNSDGTKINPGSPGSDDPSQDDNSDSTGSSSDGLLSALYPDSATSLVGMLAALYA